VDCQSEREDEHWAHLEADHIVLSRRFLLGPVLGTPVDGYFHLPIMQRCLEMRKRISAGGVLGDDQRAIYLSE